MVVPLASLIASFLFHAFTGSKNTEHLLLGEQPENFGYFRRFFHAHVADFHASGLPSNSTMAEGGKVYLTMVNSGDFCMSSAPLYTELFFSGLDVFVYSSNLDPLLGPPTTAAGVQSAWDSAAEIFLDGPMYKNEFYSQRKVLWKVEDVDSTPAGYVRCVSRGGARFCYIVVRNAGHETAPYAPRAAYDMNSRIIGNRSFEKGSVDTPRCAACGGAPPLAGTALPACQASTDNALWQHAILMS